MAWSERSVAGNADMVQADGPISARQPSLGQRRPSSMEKIMLRKFISAAVATVVVAIGEISLGPSPAEAWFYNQPYNRPCFWYEHQWYYEYYGHRHYYNFGYHYYGSGYYPHHKYGSAGPVVDCI
jgi:hypothetical protein